MDRLDMVGAFHGFVVDKGVAKSKGGFPQFVAQIESTEFYNEESEEWEEHTGEEILAYLILYTDSKGQLFHVENLAKAFGYEGGDFYDWLNEGDFSRIPIQFRTAENTYDGKTTIQVQSIVPFGDDPVRQLRKLDAKDLKVLSRTHPVVVSGAKAATPTPVSAPSPAAPVKKKAGRPKGSKGKPKVDIPKKKISKAVAQVKKEAKPKTMTDEEAWESLMNQAPDTVSEDQRSKAWLEAGYQVAGEGVDNDDVTEEQWASIHDVALDLVNGIAESDVPS